MVLKDEIQRLDDYEKTIDQHKAWVQQSIKNITEDPSNAHLSYVTHEDICAGFQGETLLAIQAPNDTKLEVPIPEGQIYQQKKKYQIHLKSSEGQIYVLLINKDSDSEQPFVAEVPLPKDVQAAIDQDDSRRKPGQKAKLEDSPEAPKAKRSKVDSEVEAVFGKVLDTEIPELEEIMSNEGETTSPKFFFHATSDTIFSL